MPIGSPKPAVVLVRFTSVKNSLRICAMKSRQGRKPATGTVSAATEVIIERDACNLRANFKRDNLPLFFPLPTPQLHRTLFNGFLLQNSPVAKAMAR